MISFYLFIYQSRRDGYQMVRLEIEHADCLPVSQTPIIGSQTSTAGGVNLEFHQPTPDNQQPNPRIRNDPDQVLTKKCKIS